KRRDAKPSPHQQHHLSCRARFRCRHDWKEPGRRRELRVGRAGLLHRSLLAMAPPTQPIIGGAGNSVFRERSSVAPGHTALPRTELANESSRFKVQGSKWNRDNTLNLER